MEDLMAALRGEQGCPWDKKQSVHAFKTFLLEEVYELIEAIEKEDYTALAEELGDLLFHIVFIARICEEKGAFDIRDVINATYTKMYNRHPHVFLRGEADIPIEGAPEIDYRGPLGDNLSSEHGEREGEAHTALPGEGATRAPQIEKRWEELKREEKENYSPISGVPKILPALLRAYAVSKRASRLGFDWERIDDVYEKMHEEIGELKEAEKIGDPAHVREEIGDLLFTIVQVARFRNVDPEDALRSTIDKFVRRFAYIEQNLDLSASDLSAMDALWNEIKKKEKEGG